MYDNPFRKKDPLLEAVKGAMQDGETRRQAEAIVNEAFGVYSRKAVILEQLKEYDAAVEEVYAELKEANDGNLANNYPPYDKVTRGDVIAGRLGKDQMGGKRRKAMEEGLDVVDSKSGKTIGGTSSKMDPNDPSVQGSGDVTSTPARSSRPVARKAPDDSSVQGSGDVTSGGKPVRVKEDAGGFFRGLFTGGNADKKPNSTQSAVQGAAQSAASKVTGGVFDRAGAAFGGSSPASAEDKKNIREQQLDELLRKTLKSYQRKARTSADRAWVKADKEEDKAMSTDGDKYPYKQERHMKNAAGHVKTWQKRDAGLKMVAKKLAKEETHLRAKDRAAHLSKHGLKKPFKRSVDEENLNELDRSDVKPLLPTYVDKAWNDVTNKKSAPEPTKEKKMTMNELSYDTVARYHRKAAERFHTGEEPQEKRAKGRELATRKRAGGMMGIPKAKVMAKEETQIDEISKELAGRYIRRSAGDRERLAIGDEKLRVARDSIPSGLGHSRETSDLGWKMRASIDKETDKVRHKQSKRSEGMRNAVGKLTGRARVNANEEAQLDELSGATLGSYIQKAHADVKKRKEHRQDVENHPSVKKWTDRVSATYRTREYTSAAQKAGDAKRTTGRARAAAARDKVDPDHRKNDHRIWARGRGIEKAAERLRYNKKLTEQSEVTSALPKDEKGWRGVERPRDWTPEESKKSRLEGPAAELRKDKYPGL